MESKHHTHADGYGEPAMRRSDMPYQHLSDLPASVRENLPHHAQEIYRAAFNNAWDAYDHDEERAHRVAWAAVKQVYEKDADTGEWQRQQEHV
jgi:cation transport regulator